MVSVKSQRCATVNDRSLPFCQFHIYSTGTPGVEDILAKYRGKAQAETGELNSNELIEKKLIETEEEERLSEESIFINAKQKLRKVFGSSDLQFCSSVSAVSLFSFLFSSLNGSGG